MALTVEMGNFPARDRMNDRLIRELVLTGPASYVTGGVAIDQLNDLGLGTVFGVYGVLRNAAGTASRALSLDFTNQKVQVYVADVEIANGVDLSSFAGTVLITGK